ncbi:MAG: GNAT family N-acetyltransferase [Burkholderiaceae bacterium]|jgi:CelD/BcsL family acetyltransferase involved in cellulose biosynthesis|nr:GNAT family N-acetyltransferase [Burkholderiales bacterium]MCZ8099215.1 GNAT family N-acetyltransferase [Burkholderiales bacterium]MCZ8337328.1 GNAT family N-acetyltransferase [Burkholderiaceae bacterium]
MRPDLDGEADEATWQPSGGAVAPGDLQGGWLSGPEAFERLGEGWNALAEQSEHPALCAGLAWGRSWWETFAVADDRLFVFACWHEGVLIGLAAFVASRRRVRRCSPFVLRVLHMLGSGERDEDDVAAEYGDVLVAAGYEAAYSARLGAALVDGDGPRWDVAFLYNQLDGAVSLQRLLPVLQRLGCHAVTEPCGVRYVVPLPDSWEAFLATLGATFRAKLRSDRRRLARAGTLEVETLGGREGARRGIARLAALHSARWRGKGEYGAFHSATVLGFHRRLLESAGGPEHGEVLVATLDGRDLAAVYTLRVGATVHFYQSGFEAGLAPNVSLGAYVLGLAIERAIAAGASEFDLMKGQVPSYKARYGGFEVPMVHATVFAPTPHGRFSRLFAAGVDLLRAALRAATAARSSSRPPASGAA